MALENPAFEMTPDEVREDKPKIDETNNNRSFPRMPAKESNGFTNFVNIAIKELPANPIRLIWDNVGYHVTTSKWTFENMSKLSIIKKELKQILKPQHGEVTSGSLTAIMGPSGAGKSTLLNCLTGRYTQGMSGEAYVTAPEERGKKRMKRVTVAYIPQTDHFFGVFTVREALLFASKLKNHEISNHEMEVNRVLKHLNLESCSDVRMSNCSGGQVKRVSVGVELISKPDILVLDEPSTGLDSSTAFQSIELLRKLTETTSNAPAIVCTIHQPNHKIFSLFHQVYLMSKNGHNLYFGPPLEITDFFLKFGFICPSYCNPADYAIEVAYGDLGEECFERMAEVTLIGNKRSRMAPGPNESKLPVTKIISRMRSEKAPFLAHLWLLFLRNWGVLFRDSTQFWLRNAQNAVVALLVAFFIEGKTGGEDGCWADFFEPPNGTSVQEHYLQKVAFITQNTAGAFTFCIYILMVSTVLSVLTFPLETSIILKEMNNNWYKVKTYYAAKVLADWPPMLVTTLVYCGLNYPLTGQILVFWRFWVYYAVGCLLSEICSVVGIIIGIIFSEDFVSAVFVGAASAVPAYMFGGFMVRYSEISWYFRPLSDISYMRYAFESLMIAIYGFDRCPDTGISYSTEKVKAVLEKDPVEALASLFPTPNISLSNSNLFAGLLGVDKECMTSVINRTIDYLGLKDQGPEDPGEVANGTFLMVAEPEVRQPSYVMSYFDIRDNQLFTNLLALIGFSLFLRLVAYLLLSRKLRATH